MSVNLLESEFCDLEDFDSEDNNDINKFILEIEPIIKQCIKNYFVNKNFHDGEKIENYVLELPYYVSLLLNTTVSEGVNKAYKIIEENNFANNSVLDDSIAEEVRYMISLIKRIQKFVPQEFVGGMILMHLELIEGLEIW